MIWRVGESGKASLDFKRKENGDFKHWARGLNRNKGVIWEGPEKETMIPGCQNGFIIPSSRAPLA